MCSVSDVYERARSCIFVQSVYSWEGSAELLLRGGARSLGVGGLPGILKWHRTQRLYRMLRALLGGFVHGYRCCLCGKMTQARRYHQSAHKLAAGNHLNGHECPMLRALL